MTFAWPHLLWLLLAPAVFLAWELTRRRLAASEAHPKILQAEAGAHSLRLAPPASGLTPGPGRARPWLAIGIACAIVALARPQWGRIDQPVFDQSREILIAIDLSKSMLTPDVKPSRLDRAKLLTQSLLEKLSGERVGLVVFSGTAFLQSPLSADYEILREFLPALNPGFLPEGGTNYGALLETALDAFSTDAGADRFLIILSDGEATDDHWRDPIDALKKRGIRVLGLGLGTADGAMIPDGSGGFVKDDRGAVVMSKLESGTLRQLADATSGAYRDASGWVDLADLLNATVEAGRKGKFVDKSTLRHVERFQWPLALALWCLLVSFCYEFPVRPKPRDLKLGAAAPDRPAPAAPPKLAATASTTTTAVSAIALLLVFAAPARLRAAENPAPPVSTVALSKIVGRLAGAEPAARTARDWAELAQETVTWGSHLQSAQQSVPAGPIHDALAAVDLGAKQDAKTADWPKLRSQLEDLLKQSEEQKKQQQQQDQKNDQQNKDQKDRQDQKNQQQDKNQSGSPKDQQNQQQKQDGSSSQKQDQQQKKNSSDQKKPDAGQQQQNGSPQKPQQKDGTKPQSAFGDMKSQTPPPPPSSQEMQKVGGTPPKSAADQPPVDPALALPMQKLQQLRQQDSPAELFQLMDADQHPAPAPSTTKDW